MIRRYTLVAGLLFLVTVLAGFFGEMYVPSKLVATDLRGSEGLLRLGFASYLIEALCDVTLAWLMYVLLRPVQKDVALLAAFFGLVSTALFGFAELFYVSSTLVLRDADYLKSFSMDQRNTLAMLSLKTYGLGSGVFMVFYGVASLLRGWLIFRSGYLPKFLGVLLGTAGIGFIARNFLLVLAPRYASDLFLLPMFLSVVALTVWFLAKGVDLTKFEERAAARAALP